MTTRQIDILKPGNFKPGSGGEWIPDEAHLKELAWATNLFNDHHDMRTPVGIAHDKEGGLTDPKAPSVGKVDNLVFRDGRLFADFNPNGDEVAAFLKDGFFDSRSVEVWPDGSKISGVSPDLKEQLTGKPVLRRLALLGADVPAVKGLTPMSMLMGDGTEYITIIQSSESKNIPGGPGGAHTDDGPGGDAGELELYMEDKLRKELESVENKVKKLKEKLEADATASTKNLAEKDADIKKLTEERDSLKGKVTEHEAKAAKAGDETEFTKLLSEGKITPAEKDYFMLMIPVDSEETISLGEGDDAKKMTQRAAFLTHYRDKKAIIKFGEDMPSGQAQTNVSDASDDDKQDAAIHALAEKDGVKLGEKPELYGEYHAKLVALERQKAGGN